MVRTLWMVNLEDGVCTRRAAFEMEATANEWAARELVDALQHAVEQGADRSTWHSQYTIEEIPADEYRGDRDWGVRVPR